MQKLSILVAILVASVGLAGCADDADPQTTTTPTATTAASVTPTVTPTVTATATPTTTPDATPEPTPDGPPTPMECEGDYVTEDAPGERIGLPELTFTVKDADAADPCYAFVGPATATSGWTVITLTQPGMEFHIMPMYFVGERTMQDFVGAMMASEEGAAPPEWVVPSGAVGGVTAHQTGSIAMDLQEGNYVYFCPIGGHMFQGMMGQLAVTAAEGEARAEPTADATVHLVDYNFTVPEMTADVHVVQVVNDGTEPHEAPLVQLEEGASAMQFLMALEDPNAAAPPPGALIGGVNAIAPGMKVYMLVEFVHGTTYAMACFVESPTHGGAPHLELGMVAEFTVA